MKGSIINCLEELVVKDFGKDKWEMILQNAGFAKHSAFLSIQDIDEAMVLKLVDAMCSILNLTLSQAADAFGEFWMCSYAPMKYELFFSEMKTAKDFIMKMDKIHQVAQASIPNAHPPRFDYSWENDNTLIMKYKSSRNLIDFMIGLAKGVGKHFHENLLVSKLSADSVKIVFPLSSQNRQAA